VGLILPGNTFSGQGICQNRNCLVLVDFVIFQIDQVEIIFAEFLEMAQVFITDCVAFMKGGTFEFARTYLASFSLTFLSTVISPLSDG